MKLSCINISMFIYTNLIAQGFDHMGKTLNVDDEHRSRIAMKNEFAYERLMTTPVKKRYAGMLMAQEGVVLTGPPEKRLDMKGLNIKKSSTNKNIRTFFTKTIIDKILTPKEINLADVYSDFEYMEKNIRDSLNKGELEFSQPGKVNSIDKYAKPLTQQTFRGTALWNALFPETPIMPPEKINFIKLKPIKYTEFINSIPEEYKDKVIDLYNKKFDPEKKLSDYDVNILCIPKSVEVLPEFLRKFIDIDLMVHDQIKTVMELLTPLGFKSLDILDNSYSTNMINI